MILKKAKERRRNDKMEKMGERERERETRKNKNRNKNIKLLLKKNAVSKAPEVIIT